MQFIEVAEFSDRIIHDLTSWTEWSPCSVRCTKTKYRTCSGYLECPDDRNCSSDNLKCEEVQINCAEDEVNFECFKEVRYRLISSRDQETRVHSCSFMFGLVHFRDFRKIV